MKLSEENIEGRVQDNVFYDTFKETMEFYADTRKEVWEEAATISLYDTAGDVGLFEKSDIIIVYDRDNGKPMIVTERIYSKNYTWNQWRKMKRYLRMKTSVIKQELGFNVRISFGHGYIDYVHYKEEWWQWALKQSNQQQ